MKKKIFLVGVVVAVFFAFGIVKYSYNTGVVKAENKDNTLKSGAVYAYVPVGAVVYDNIDGKCVDMIASGKKVEIIKDRSKQWYYVKYGSHLGWVKENSLKIPPDSGTEQKQLSADFIESYADKNFSSKTPHFVWVDIDRQRIYILERVSQKDQGNIMLIDKLAMAYLKNGEKENAIQYLKREKDNENLDEVIYEQLVDKIELLDRSMDKFDIAKNILDVARIFERLFSIPDYYNYPEFVNIFLVLITGYNGKNEKDTR